MQYYKAPSIINVQKIICQNITSCDIQESSGFNCESRKRVEKIVTDQLQLKFEDKSCIEIAMFGEKLEGPFLITCSDSPQIGMFMASREWFPL